MSASTSVPPAVSQPAPTAAETAASEPAKQEAVPKPEGQASNSAPVGQEPAQTLPANGGFRIAGWTRALNLAQLTGAWAPSAEDRKGRGSALIYRQPMDEFAQAASSTRRHRPAYRHLPRWSTARSK